MQEQPPAFGEQLRTYRARAGLTQEALAERVGLAASTISALERGARRRPYPHTRQWLAEALGLSKAEQAAFFAERPVARAAGAESSTPSPPARTNLPAPRTPLIGRAREAAALRALILQDQTRLVTLTGVGGCGKTRLALQVAADLQAALPGGAWLAELAPITDPGVVPQAVAAALGIQDTSAAPLVDTLLTWLGRQPLLLVLDNCEHLVDACAELAERLLSSCPSLRLLATSREPLQVAGERQWRVPALAAPELDEAVALAELAAYPAVQLFVVRAQAVAPGFRLTEANAATIGQVCARLEGLPLALELAAARARVLAIEQILDRLDDALRLLTGGGRAAPTRQQTMRAALDWSYSLLTPAEQAVFERLAVFAGGCDLEAAEAACIGADLPPDEVLDVLSRLVDKSLLLVEERTATARYRLLEPVRQYALARLKDSGGLELVRAAHAAHYRALADRAAPALRGPAQVAWLNRLEGERDNLRAALHYAASSGEVESALRLAVALAPFWDAHGHLSEGRRWLDTLLASPLAAAVPATLRARTLLAGGRLAQWQTDLEAAAVLLEECLALARPLHDRPLIAEALVYLGAVRRRQGSLASSVLLLEQSLALYGDADDPWGVALALTTLAVTIRFQGDAARSATLLEESLELFRQVGDVRWIAITLTMLGYALLRQGGPDRAGRLILEGLAGHRAVGDRAFLIFGLLDMAAVYAAQGQPRRAARMLGAMAALCETLGVGLAPMNRADHDPVVVTLRGQLGEPDFERAWTAGRALTLDQALQEALAPVAPASSRLAAATSPGGPPEPLTSREEEVARLLARGLTDRQIADALVISIRTVGVHVQHLIAKLGVRSRWQVADWAAQRPVERDTGRRAMAPREPAPAT